MKCRMLKTYTTYVYGFPLTIPVGAIGELWLDRMYTFEAIDNHVPYVERWAVEAWSDIFETFEDVTKETTMAARFDLLEDIEIAVKTHAVDKRDELIARCMGMPNGAYLVKRLKDAL